MKTEMITIQRTNGSSDTIEYAIPDSVHRLARGMYRYTFGDEAWLVIQPEKEVEEQAYYWFFIPEDHSETYHDIFATKRDAVLGLRNWIATR